MPFEKGNHPKLLINHGTITVTAYYVGTWDDFPGLRNKTTCVYRNVRFHVPDVHQPPMIPAIIIHQLHSPLQGICGRLLFHVFHDLRYGWMATRNPVNSPLEVGSLAHYLHCNYTSQVGKLAGFSDKWTVWLRSPINLRVKHMISSERNAKSTHIFQK